MDIEAISFNPYKITYELFKFMKYQANEKGLNLEYQTSYPPNQCLIGDPGRVRQILTNLLSNSLKFTREGTVKLSLNVLKYAPIAVEPSLEVKTNLPRTASPSLSGDPDVNKTSSPSSTASEARDQLGGETVLLCFTVEDQGIGINETVLRTLFQAFHQADPSTARIYGGTGLGLSITKQLIGLMGGQIEMTSVLGSGTKATVTIPFRLANGDGRQPIPIFPLTSVKSRTSFSASKPPSPRRESFACSSGGRSSPSPLTPVHSHKATLHILVVEDNAINQKVALKILAKLGYSASAVWNGQEALEYLSQPPSSTHLLPQIILMDCMMPKMDGYQATRAIRTSADFSNKIKAMPIIALTAAAIDGDRKRCKEAGMDDYLAKPIALDSLERMLVKWSPQR